MRTPYQLRAGLGLFLGLLLSMSSANGSPSSDPPRRPGAGTRVIATPGGITIPEGAVVICSDTTPGLAPVPTKHVFKNIANWDQAIDRFRAFGDGSVPAFVLDGHGSSDAGVTTSGTWLDLPNLSEANAALIRAKLRPDAPIIILGCHVGASDRLRELAAKLQRRVIANTGSVNIDIIGEGEWVDVNAPARGNVLEPGALLRPGESRTSPNGTTRLVMQEDGNLVLYRDGRAVWASNTFGQNGAYCVMQTDSNLVMYGARGSIWASNTHNRGAWVELVVQDDGNLVLYQVGRPIWATNTHR